MATTVPIQKIMVLNINVVRHIVCIFEFGSLGFVGNLVLGVWSLKFFVTAI